MTIKPLPAGIDCLHLLLSYTVSVLRNETENRTLLLTATGAFRKPDENGPSSSSESGFGELVGNLRHPVPQIAVPFKSSTRKLRKTSLEGKLKKATCCKNQLSVLTAKQMKEFV